MGWGGSARRAAGALGRLWTALLLILAWMGPAAAAEPSPAFTQRAGELVRLLNGEVEPARFFSPAFLAQVPPQQVTAISNALRSSHGRAKSASRIEAETALAGTLFVAFERATVRMKMALDPKPPNLVAGLLVVGAESSAADVPALFGEIVGLPGEVSLAAARLEDARPGQLPHPESRAAAGDRLRLQAVRARRAGPPGEGRRAALERRRPARRPFASLRPAPGLAERLAAHPAQPRRADDLEERQQRRRHPDRHPRPGEDREPASGARGARAGAQPALPLDPRGLRPQARRSGPARALEIGRRSRPEGASRPAEGGADRPSAARPDSRPKSSSPNGSPRPPTSSERSTGCGAAATRSRSTCSRSIRGLGPPWRRTSPISASRAAPSRACST